MTVQTELAAAQADLTAGTTALVLHSLLRLFHSSELQPSWRSTTFVSVSLL